MSDPTALALLVSAGVARRSARSALPDAPVVDSGIRPVEPPVHPPVGRVAAGAVRRPVARRTRAGVAAALVRLADAVAPACPPDVPGRRSPA